MEDDELYEGYDPVSAWPRLAWSDDDPGRPVEERLALVALAERAAAFPSAALLEATVALEDPVAPRPAGVVLLELRCGLAEAAVLIAEAPWGGAPGVASVARDAAGVARVMPSDDLPLDELFSVEQGLALASFVGLTEDAVDVRGIPLRLAADGRPGAPPPFDPAPFMFAGTAETPVGDRLWLYQHAVTRGWLNLDGEGGPWRYDPAASSYARCDLRAALMGIDAPGVGDGEGAGL